MRRLWVLVVVVGVLAGCGGGGSGDAAPSCSEMFAEGVTTTKAMADEGCVDEAGEVVYRGAQVTDCGGRELRSNDLGYGFTGGPWHRYRSGQTEPPWGELGC